MIPTRLRAAGVAAGIAFALAATAPATASPSAPAAPTAPAAPAAPPAGCGDLDPADAAAVVDRAGTVDDVFVGTVASIGQGGDPATAAPSPTPGQQAPVVHTVTVGAVLAGDITEGGRVDVLLSPPASAPTQAPPQLAVNGSYLFWASASADGDPTLLADGCEGWTTAPADPAVLDTLRTEIEAAEQERGEVPLAEPVGGAAADPELGRLLAPGGAAVLVGVLGLGLVSRLSRRRS